MDYFASTLPNTPGCIPPWKRINLVHKRKIRSKKVLMTKMMVMILINMLEEHVMKMTIKFIAFL